MEKWDGVERRSTKHFLFIDDNSDFLELAKKICVSKRIGCVTTKSPTEFIEEFESGRYDATIIDYKLTLIDGVSLIRLVDIKKSPRTRIYIVTEYDREFIKSKVNGDKIDGIFLKSQGIGNVLTAILMDLSNEL